MVNSINLTWSVLNTKFLDQHPNVKWVLCFDTKIAGILITITSMGLWTSKAWGLCSWFHKKNPWVAQTYKYWAWETTTSLELWLILMWLQRSQHYSSKSFCKPTKIWFNPQVLSTLNIGLSVAHIILIINPQ